MSALRFPEWQKPCELALLEPDPEKLFQRVIVAETAIYHRLRDSKSSPTNIELKAIADMLSNLQCLIANTFTLPDGERTVTKEPRTIIRDGTKVKRSRRQAQPSV